MKIQFFYKLNSQPYDVILPISFGDRVDGVADTLSFEFLANEDLLLDYKKYQKSIVEIRDDNDNLIKEFRMCITDINRDLNTTAYENDAPKYTYSVTLCEPSVLIQKSNRTDIAITPYAYAKVDDRYPYENLYDAYCKICSCHNLNVRNEPICNNYVREFLTRENNKFYATSMLNLNKALIKGKIKAFNTTLINTKIYSTLVVIIPAINPIWIDGLGYTCNQTLTFPLQNDIILPVSRTITLTTTIAQEEISLDRTLVIDCDEDNNVYYYLLENPEVDMNYYISTYGDTSNLHFTHTTYYLSYDEQSINQNSFFPVNASFLVYTSPTFIIENLYDTINIQLTYNSNEEVIMNITSSGNKKYTNAEFDYDLEVAYYNDGGKKIYDALSKVACPTITYQDLSTFSQLQDLFGRVGAIPYLTFDNNGMCYLTLYSAQGDFEGSSPKVLDYFSSEEASKIDPLHSTTISSQVKNMVCDNDTITYPSRWEYLLRSNNYASTIYVNNSSTYDIFSNFEDYQSGVIKKANYLDDCNTFAEITMIVPNSYNEKANKIESANNYYVELPTAIENILYIYKIEPYTSSTYPSRMKFVKLYDSVSETFNNKQVIEYSEFSKLEDTQKRYFAYFVRGDNRINQAVSLISTVAELNQDFMWDKDNLYNDIRRCRLCVVYKPMINMEYTYYDYNNLTSKTTEYINTPYKLVSDKQLSSILSYEYQKRDSTNISFKIVTTDINELSHYAGEKVFLKEHKLFDNWNMLSENFYGKEYVSSYTGNTFDTLDELNDAYYTILEDNDAKTWFYKNAYNVWCYVGEDVYTINQDTNKWEKYLGELCVITKMDVSINNNTIEITYELSNKIANNSVYSNYSDNIRVSDNLSTSNVVTRNVMITKSFLMNAHAKTTTTVNSEEINLYPSFDVASSRKPLFDTYDAQLYSNGMLKLGFNNNFKTYVSGTGYVLSDYSNIITGVDRLRYLSTNIVYDSFNSQFQTWDLDTSSKVDLGLFTAGEFQFRKSLRRIISDTKYLTFTYDNDPTSATYQKLTKNNRNDFDYLVVLYFRKRYGKKERYDDYLLPPVEVISSYYINYPSASHRFKYVYDGGNYLYFAHSEDNGSTWENIYVWSIPTDAYIMENYMNGNVYFYGYSKANAMVGFYRDNLIREGVLNSNGLWIKSGNIIVDNFSFEPASIGTSAFGLSSNNRFNYTKPIFYNRSNSISTLNSIGSLESNISKFNFIDIIKYYGFTDLNLDLREKINVSLQYVIIPANTFDLYDKEDLWNYNITHSGQAITLFPNRNGTNINAEEKTLQIVEINTNVDFLNNICPNVDDTYSGHILKLYKMPKGCTINDYLRDKSIATIYSDGIATQSSYMNAYSIPEVTFLSTLNSDDEYNYLLVNNDDIPLILLSTSGITSTNTICFDAIVM